MPAYAHSIARWLAATLVTVAATTLLAWLGANSTTAGMVFLVLVVWFAAQAGILLALYTALLCAVSFDYYFLPPVGTLIMEPQSWVALLAFLATAFTASKLSANARRRAAEADSRRVETERLYALVQAMMLTGGASKTLREFVHRVVREFGSTAAAFYYRATDEVVRSGPESAVATEHDLRVAAELDGVRVDYARGLALAPVRLGSRPLGSLAMVAPLPSAQTIQAVADLVALTIEKARALEEAGPSTPVEVLGLESMPDSGDTFLVVADRDKAKGIAQYRKMKEREAQLAKSSRVSLEGLAEQIRQAGVKDLPLIIKGDVTGSVEVLADSLVKMSTEKVRIKVIHSGVGSITESDVLLATASNTIIIGFNVRPERKAAELAQQEGIQIRLHSIIYELQDEIRLAMMGLLEPAFKENYVGRAEVINVFRIPKVGTIAGCRVLDGVIRRDAEVKVMRGEEQVFKGKIGSLKRFKDDAREVSNGMECGIGLGGFSDLKEGDLIEAFSMEKLAADLGALTSAKA